MMRRFTLFWSSHASIRIHTRASATCGAGVRIPGRASPGESQSRTKLRGRMSLLMLDGRRCWMEDAHAEVFTVHAFDTPAEQGCVRLWRVWKAGSRHTCSSFSLPSCSVAWLQSRSSFSSAYVPLCSESLAAPFFRVVAARRGVGMTISSWLLSHPVFPFFCPAKPPASLRHIPVPARILPHRLKSAYALGRFTCACAAPFQWALRDRSVRSWLCRKRCRAGVRPAGGPSCPPGRCGPRIRSRQGGYQARMEKGRGGPTGGAVEDWEPVELRLALRTRRTSTREESWYWHWRSTRRRRLRSRLRLWEARYVPCPRRVMQHTLRSHKRLID
ncbi:hypothetical protein C8R45DRAFT_124488 [Mycena sanguinolenta]|nr:hypothetical protein C8R45DRAFT_124488 [Mycena sanguinolenta]